ncbi:hypothetical protein PMAYCL1PPCAC_27593, partial [Pristionchus mayeri]
LNARNLAYFWGTDALPVNSSECIEYQLSNDNRTISLCNRTAMSRCQRPKAFIAFRHSSYCSKQFNFRVTNFAWLCPVGTVCCEWECCEI